MSLEAIEGAWTLIPMRHPSLSTMGWLSEEGGLLKSQDFHYHLTICYMLRSHLLISIHHDVSRNHVENSRRCAPIPSSQGDIKGCLVESWNYHFHLGIMRRFFGVNRGQMGSLDFWAHLEVMRQQLPILFSQLKYT